MTSATFSAPRAPHDLVSFTRRGGTDSSATSQAADEALRQLIDRRRLRNKHGGEREAKLSLIGTFTDAIGDAVNDSVRRFGLPMWLVRVSLAVGVAAVLFGSALLAMPDGSERYGISGRVSLNGKPLADGTLEFHRTDDAAAEPFWVAVYTNPDGTFRRDASAGLPAGRYAVVVKAGHVAAAPKAGPLKPALIPPTYTQPTSTPLTVEITQTASDLHLLVRK